LKIFIKKNVRNHSYHQFYPVLAKIRLTESDGEDPVTESALTEVCCISIAYLAGHASVVIATCLMNDKYKLNHCKEMGAEPGRRFLTLPAAKLEPELLSSESYI